VGFSSIFNTILPNKLGISVSVCLWIRDLLTDCFQRVRVDPHVSPAISLSTGSPQGCVLCPLLYTLYTHDCTSTHPSNNIIKFADDTTVVGLITAGDELAYRDEVERMTVWCTENNLMLNTTKTMEIVLDFRRRKEAIQPLFIGWECVERMLHIEHLHVLYLRVVSQLHCSRQKGAPEGRHHSPEDLRLPPPLFTGTI